MLHFLIIISLSRQLTLPTHPVQTHVVLYPPPPVEIPYTKPSLIPANTRRYILELTFFILLSHVLCTSNNVNYSFSDLCFLLLLPTYQLLFFLLSGSSLRTRAVEEAKERNCIYYHVYTVSKTLKDRIIERHVITKPKVRQTSLKGLNYFLRFSN